MGARGCRWVLVLAACGPEVEEPLVCGGDGPMELLVLEEDALREGHVGFTVRDGRGWLALVGDRGLALECGEPPREFVGDVSALTEVAEADVRWLAHRVKPARPGGASVVVDPWGDADPFALPGHPLATIDGAIVSVEEADWGDHTPMRVTSVSAAGGPAQRDVSYALQRPDDFIAFWESLWHFHAPIEPREQVFGLVRAWYDSPHEAVAIDVRTGAVEVVGSDAGEIAVHARGRFVVLVPRDETVASRLVDRETGRETTVGEAGWVLPHGRGDPSLIVAQGYDEPTGVQSHLVFLPSLEELWLEGAFESEPYWLTHDGRRILESEAGLWVVRPGDGAPTFLYPGRGDACDVGHDVYLWDHGLYEGDEAEQGPWDRLVRIPLDGSGPEVVIEGPLARALPLEDGRWAIDRDWSDSSELLLHDPRTGAEELLAEMEDTFVVDPLPQTTWDVCPHWISADTLHDELRWLARDPEDSRRKLWRFAL